MGLFDIYSKEDWRTIMAKEKEIRLEKVLQDMSFSLKHIGLDSTFTAWDLKHRIPRRKLPIWSYSQV